MKARFQEHILSISGFQPEVCVTYVCEAILGSTQKHLT